jgi:predicted flap endonuclease-1-like 5' DNA nuclease
MSLLDKLKAVLGGGSSRESSSNAGSGTAGATTTASASSERAVKEPVDATPSGSSTTEPSIDSSSVDTADETPETADAITEAESANGDGGVEDPSTADADGERGTGPAVSEISGIGPAYSDRLQSIGVETVDQLAEAEPDDIASQTDISIGRVSNWIERARNF